MTVIRLILQTGFAAVACWTSIGSAHANDISFALNARVSEHCSVIDSSGVVTDPGTTFRVNAVCNAANFRLRMAGDLAGLTIARARTAGSAAVSVAGDQVTVSPMRPGAFQFDIFYAEKLTQVYHATFVIESF